MQVTVQTDKVTDIPCGTSGGVMIYFAKIEVINWLRRDMVYETVKNYTVDYDKTWIYDRCVGPLQRGRRQHEYVR